MKILVTGAGGMLGSELCAYLAPHHSLVGVGRREAPYLQIPYRQIDLGSLEMSRDLILEERPVLIFHAAAMTDVDRCESHRLEALRANFELTRNVTDGGNSVRALVVFFSTDFVFDGTKEGPYDEEDLPRPLSVYGQSKWLAERYLTLRGKRYLIFRTSWLFGKRGHSFPKKVLKQAEEGKPFPVVSDQIGNPAFAGDLAEAMRTLVEILSRGTKGLDNQIYHIANEGVVSRFEMARFILEKKGYDPNLVLPVSSETLKSRPAARPRNSSLSTEKIKARFGIRLRPWQEALEASLQENLSSRLKAET